MTRAAALLLLPLLAACTDKPPGAAAPLDEDSALLAAVVQDLLVHPDFKTYPAWNARPKLVIGDRTRGPSAFLSKAQLSGELDGAPSWGLDLADELSARNAGTTPIPTSAFTNPRVIGVLDADFQALVKRPQESRVEWFEEKYPDAKAYVHFWRPALSSDGQRALVRFSFGPTPHGACGTYLIEKDGSGWAIRYRDFAYYA
jgi:hypothetical protein